MTAVQLAGHLSGRERYRVDIPYVGGHCPTDSQQPHARLDLWKRTRGAVTTS